MSVPSSSDWHDDALRRARKEIDANRIEEAEQILTQLLSARPDDVGALHARGVCSFKRWNLADSEKFLLSVLHLQPRHRDALYMLGRVRERLNDRDGAATYFRRVVQIDKKYHDAADRLRRLGGFSRPADFPVHDKTEMVADPSETSRGSAKSDTRRDTLQFHTGELLQEYSGHPPFSSAGFLFSLDIFLLFAMPFILANSNPNTAVRDTFFIVFLLLLQP